MNPLLWRITLLGMLGLILTRIDLAILVGIFALVVWELTD